MCITYTQTCNKQSHYTLLQVAGNSEITCWAWEVDGVMQLRFGGHDSEAETVLQAFPTQRRATKTNGGTQAAIYAGGGGGGGTNAAAGSSKVNFSPFLSQVVVLLIVRIMLLIAETISA